MVKVTRGLVLLSLSITATEDSLCSMQNNGAVVMYHHTSVSCSRNVCSNTSILTIQSKYIFVRVASCRTYYRFSHLNMNVKSRREVQKSAARLIYRLRLRDHVGNSLKQLHRLRIRSPRVLPLYKQGVLIIIQNSTAIRHRSTLAISSAADPLCALQTMFSKAPDQVRTASLFVLWTGTMKQAPT